MAIQIDTVTLPAYWASYFVHGDVSGLDETEKAHADYAIDQLGEWYVVDIVRSQDGEDVSEPRFTWHYKLYDTLSNHAGGSVLDYVIHKQGE